MRKPLGELVRKILPSCKDVTALISRSLEIKLSWRESLALKYHLWLCEPCSRYLSHLKFMSRVFESKENKAPTLSPEAAERIKNALKPPKLLLILLVINCWL